MESVLEVLQKKIQPKTQQSFFRTFDHLPESGTEEGEPPMQVQIIDKRENANVDMDIITEKLKKMSIVTNKFKPAEIESKESETDMIIDLSLIHI